MENKEFNLKKKREELFEQCKENYENSYGLTKGATDWSSIDWIIKEVLRCVKIQDYEFTKKIKELPLNFMDEKMFDDAIDKLAGDKKKVKRRKTTSIRISRSHKK